MHEVTTGSPDEDEIVGPFAAAELVTPATPGQVAGFTIVRALGRGGTGTVHLARQEPLDRLVALKLLDPQLASDETFTARFYREAKSAALFQHPNVVAIHAAGQDAQSGLHWIAFEYMRGGSLEDLLAREGVLSEQQALQLILGVARALVFAEAHGLVHRDVKPGNVLLDPDGTPKLADLGLAKQADPELAPITQQGVVIGTPYYMAPEQALGCPDLDGRADIYALGLCLWRMVTGRVPFLLQGEGGAGLVKVLARRLNQSLPDVREVAPDLSEATAVILRGMTARRRRDRYASAREVVADVERALRGEPALGPQPTSALKTLSAAPRRDPEDPLASTVAEEDPPASPGGARTVQLEAAPPGGGLVTVNDPSLADTRAASPAFAAPSFAPPRPPASRAAGPLAAPGAVATPGGIPGTVIAGLGLGLALGVWALWPGSGPGPVGGDPGGQHDQLPPTLPAPLVTAVEAAAPREPRPAMPPPGPAVPLAVDPGREQDPEPAPEPPSQPWSQRWVEEAGFLLATDVERAAARRAQIAAGAELADTPARRSFVDGLEGVLAALEPGLSWTRRRQELERLQLALSRQVPAGSTPDPLRASVEQEQRRWAALLQGAVELRRSMSDPRRRAVALELLEELPGLWTATAQARRVVELCESLDAPARQGPLPGLPDPALAIGELRRGAIGRVLGEELEALDRALARVARDPERSRVEALTAPELAGWAGTELLRGRVVSVPPTAGWADLPGRGLELELNAAPARDQAIELSADGCLVRLRADALEVTGLGPPRALAWKGARRVLFESRPGTFLLRIPGAEPAELVIQRPVSGLARFTVRLVGSAEARRLLVVRVPRP